MKKLTHTTRGEKKEITAGGRRKEKTATIVQHKSPSKPGAQQENMQGYEGEEDACVGGKKKNTANFTRKKETVVSSMRERNPKI